MNIMSHLYNRTTDAEVANDVQRARTLWQRLVGLLPHREILPTQGLWFDNCSSIHTMGMRTSIDVIFLDAQHRVVAIKSGVRPNRFFVAHSRARALIELGAASSPRWNIRIGDRLLLKDARC
jgi:uncharacterized membrane protein (UPF0127 family)